MKAFYYKDIYNTIKLSIKAKPIATGDGMGSDDQGGGWILVWASDIVSALQAFLAETLFNSGSNYSKRLRRRGYHKLFIRYDRKSGKQKTREFIIRDHARSK